MLRQMREWFHYLKWLLMIIVFMFILWGVSIGVGGMSNRPTTTDWAAKVNGTEIPITAFQSYARSLDSTYQSLLGDQYAQQRAFIRIGLQAINGLVEEELAYQEALRQGITASSQEVAEAITRDPNLQENGRFVGVQRYRNLFRAGRMSVEDYEDQVRRRLVIAKLKSLVEDAVTVSDAEVREEFERRNVRESVDYLIVDPARLPGGARPSEPEIARYYEAHRERYTKGEGRTGLYVVLSATDAAGAQAVTDDEVRAAYDRDLATRFTVTEQRRASHILFKVDHAAPPDTVAKAEARARGVLKRARAGEDFAALARTYSEDGTAKDGGDLNFFGRGQMVKEFEEAAFSLPVGGVSDLVRTPYGFHIIKITDSRPGRTIPFEEARDSIRDELKTGRAKTAIAKRAADLVRAAGGGRLEAVAKSQSLTVAETGPVHDGEAVAGLAASQPVVARMMALAPGDVSEPIPIPSGQVVVQVTGTVPPEPRPLQEVRARVEKELRDESGRVAAEEAIRAAQRARGGLQAVARALKVEMKTQPDLSRGTPLPGLQPDPQIERQRSTLAPGAIGAPIVTPSGIVVLSVKERHDHHEELDAQKESIRDSLVRQRQDRLYRSLVRRLRERGNVVVNDDVVRAMDRA
jgi:peptidyl-prolyl cis-trans isomerase D